MSASRPVVTQLHILNSWHISRFSDHVSILSRVDHVLTQETFGNRFSDVIWSFSSSYMLISQRFTFTPQCHDFYARNSQHYELLECIEIGQSAAMCRRRVAAVPDASTRTFTLQRQPDANRSRPLRTPHDVVSVYRTNPTQWTQCVHGQPDAKRSRTVRASGKIVSVYTALYTQ